MNRHLQKLVCESTSTTAIINSQVIQSLWSGYGQIIKVQLQGGQISSAILKMIRLPNQVEHPRGWNSNFAHQRKVKSYEIEQNWYRQWSRNCDENCRVAHCYSANSVENEHVLVLEDLDLAGYSLRKTELNANQAKCCLRWLANFHAQFLGVEPNGLWQIGTYWHLATRPDELNATLDKRLQQAAARIDDELNNCQYKTFVHGDAKVANFCFSQDGTKVAVVDFQYVGGGCGMKDVAYFLGSCLDEQACFQWQSELLESYFTALSQALTRLQKNVDFSALKTEWLAMFPLAWADFHRFVSGWAPNHHKINAYSQAMVEKVLESFESGKI